VSPDGSRVFVTGYIVGAPGNDDYGTVAYDASTGTKLWGTRYNGLGNGNDSATALGVSPDGSKVFVTGHSIGASGYVDYATLAYDASTGTKLWVTRYKGPSSPFTDYNVSSALGVRPDGSMVFVTGYSRGASGFLDYATLAYDASTGAKLWVGRYDGSGNEDDYASALAVSPDGSKVLVTGYSIGHNPGNYDYATLAYDAATGTALWVARYNGPDSGYNGDYAKALGVSPDGSKVFVTGYSFEASGKDDGTTLAYNASTGVRVWVRRYNGPSNGNSAALALGVSPDGSKVFVSGFTAGASASDQYATLAYDASTGARLWGTRYNGPGNGNDMATALAVSPDGSKVFVTGYSPGASGSDDYATLAYDGA
jgi:outer membrane protein assembly factor BamB